MPRAEFLHAHDEVAEATVFSFRRPRGFHHVAGQWIQLKVDDAPDDPKGGARPFTIASAPHEEHLLFATLIEHGGPPSPFKQALSRLAPGDTVAMSDPVGKLTLQEEDAGSMHVLYGFGIGATSTRALASHAAHAARALRLRVVQTPLRGGHLFEAEFRSFEAAHPELAYVPLEAPPGDAEDLRRLLGEDLVEARHYLAGPAHVVVPLNRQLKDWGVSPERIRMEVYTGYEKPREVARDAKLQDALKREG